MFRQGQLAVHGLAILLGRNEAGISNRGNIFLHHAVRDSSKQELLKVLKVQRLLGVGNLNAKSAAHENVQRR